MFFTRDKRFYRSFFRLMIIVALQNVVAYSVNMADNVMLGSYSQTALSGAAAVNQIQFMVQQATIAIGEGMIMLNSQYWGKGELSPIRSITGTALKAGFVFGVGMIAAAFIIPKQPCRHIYAGQRVIAAGIEYLNIIKYTYIFYILTTIMTASLRSVKTVSIAFITSVISLIINVCINYTLIFGNFGFPEMGITGAAIGTLTARIIEFIIVLVYVLKGDKKLRLFSENPFVKNRELSRDYWRIAIPVISSNLLWSVSTPIQTVIMGHLSTDAMAANSVSTTLFQYLKVVTVSEASSTAVTMGNLIGSGVTEREKLKPYVRSLQCIFLAIGFTLGGVILAVRRPLLSMYDLTPEALELAGQMIILMAVIFAGMAYHMPVSAGIIRGSGDIKFSTCLNLISTWAIVMPLSFAAAFWWKLPAVLVVLILNSDQLFKCVPVSIWVNKYKWAHVLTR